MRQGDITLLGITHMKFYRNLSLKNVRNVIIGLSVIISILPDTNGLGLGPFTDTSHLWVREWVVTCLTACLYHLTPIRHRLMRNICQWLGPGTELIFIQENAFKFGKKKSIHVAYITKGPIRLIDNSMSIVLVSSSEYPFHMGLLPDM